MTAGRDTCCHLFYTRGDRLSESGVPAFGWNDKDFIHLGPEQTGQSAGRIFVWNRVQ